MIGRIVLVALLATTGNVTVDAVYPNPATPGDSGEFVVLDVPDGTPTDGLTLTDGEDTVSLSGIPTGGRIAVTGDPQIVSNLTELPIFGVDRFLALRNGGERVSVRMDGRPVAALTYPRAPEGERYRGKRSTTRTLPTEGTGGWAPLGRSSKTPLTVTNVTSTVFVLPDESAPIRRTFDGATERILLAGYTFSDPSAATALVDAHQRGVEVVVLLEGGPVGGITVGEVTAVERLRRAGIPVSLMGTERARYDFQHAKYAVVDDRVLVSSENWKPGGSGGHGSRGWVTIHESERLADGLASVFRDDIGWHDSRNWSVSRPTDPVNAHPDNATFPTRFTSRQFTADQATLLVAPDNAAGGVQSLLREAEDTIWVEQVSIQEDGVLMNETIAAARRGVDVRVLVSGAWFVERENRRFVEDLRRRATREDLPLAVRMVEPRSRFEYVHTKGVVVDGESVIVGSLNWNQHALTENREVAVRIDDPAAGAYFERTFLADWRGAAWRVPWGILGLALVALLIGLGVTRRFGRFERGGSALE